MSTARAKVGDPAVAATGAFALALVLAADMLLQTPAATDGRPAPLLRADVVETYIFDTYGTADVVCPNESVVAGQRYGCLASGGIRYTVEVLDDAGRFEVSRP